MLGVSKLCSPRPKAGDVLLSWARPSAYEDRAVEYLKSADLAPDRTVQNRFIAIARHYRTLAQIERRVARETSPQTRLSQRPIDQNRSGSLTSFAFVLLIIISGATTTVPLDLARARDCLAAPNSPAPKGSHWHYHLNRTTQQKCWYVRSSEKQPQQATTQTTSTGAAVPSTSAGQIGPAVTNGIDGPLELYLEPEFFKLAADETSVLQRVVQCRGVHIVSIGNNECKTLQASSPSLTSHSYNVCCDDYSKSENRKDPMHRFSIAIWGLLAQSR
jgi:hypothetical protein